MKRRNVDFWTIERTKRLHHPVRSRNRSTTATTWTTETEQRVRFERMDRCYCRRIEFDAISKSLLPHCIPTTVLLVATTVATILTVYYFSRPRKRALGVSR